MLPDISNYYDYHYSTRGEAFRVKEEQSAT